MVVLLSQPCPQLIMAKTNLNCYLSYMYWCIRMCVCTNIFEKNLAEIQKVETKPKIKRIKVAKTKDFFFLLAEKKRRLYCHVCYAKIGITKNSMQYTQCKLCVLKGCSNNWGKVIEKDFICIRCTRVVSSIGTHAINSFQYLEYSREVIDSGGEYAESIIRVRKNRVEKVQGVITPISDKEITMCNTSFVLRWQLLFSISDFVFYFNLSDRKTVYKMF